MNPVFPDNRMSPLSIKIYIHALKENRMKNRKNNVTTAKSKKKCMDAKMHTN